MILLSKQRLAAALLALCAGAAQAGVFDDDEARKAILDLRAKVDTIAKDLNARIDTKMDRTQALDFVNQQEQAMAEIAKLRGQIEVLANQIAQAEKHQKELYADLDARLKKLEPKDVTIDGRTTQVEPLEQQAYDSAIATLTGGNYDGAITALTEFLRRYPGSGYAGNAQYWLGNAYYAAGDFKAAIAAQEALLTTYSDSPKVPDALLNIATSYLELKDKKNAKKYWQMVVAKYPDSSAAATARERMKAVK